MVVFVDEEVCGYRYACKDVEEAAEAIKKALQGNVLEVRVKVTKERGKEQEGGKSDGGCLTV